MNPYILVITGLTVCLVAALVLFHLETKRFIVKKYHIASPKLPQAFAGTKLALISDLHNKVYGKENEKLLSAIEQEKPDYILIAGDMLVAKPRKDFSVSVEFLRAVSARYPVYYSYGNHECRLKEKKERYGDMGRQYEQAIAGLPLHMLHNQRMRIEKADAFIWVYGLEIAHEYYYRLKNYKMTGNYLNKKLGKKPEEYSILIAHNPSYFPAYAQWGADLVVSGHNHGGIARVPFLGGVIDPTLHLFPKYDRGVFTENETQMVLSAGTGSHSPNFRAFNPPELVMITLDRKEPCE
ncbi:MAG: metallophosphoesterase [Lachnospiraceae bacterium]|nr:metallophosphoesterase [Lachnospiraceae bacterium]